jgi:ABC-type Fe3+/spermidine/putrescine transport system ATPase subunit
MNGGRIEQLAVPSALYDEPATEFVARFIGDMSELEGRLAGDEVVLEGGGRVPLGRRLAEVVNGARVRVGLRPEEAAIAAGRGECEAAVVTAMVLGDRLQLVVRLDDGQELLLRQPRRAGDEDLARLGPGDRVGLTFAAHAGLLLSAKGGGEAAADDVAVAVEGAAP